MEWLLPLAIGFGLTGALLSISVRLGLHRERGVWASLLIAIATFYVVFAFEHASTMGIVVQSVIALGFVTLALIGYKTSLWAIAAGLVLHGVFDGLSEVLGVSPAPYWWAPFCLTADVMLGLAISYWILSDSVFKTTNRSGVNEH